MCFLIDFSEDSLCDDVIEDVLHPVGGVRQAAAEALAKLLEDRPASKTASVLDVLLATYKEKLEMIPPVVDHLGRTGKLRKMFSEVHN